MGLGRIGGQGELQEPWRGRSSSQAQAWPRAWARPQPRPGGVLRRGGLGHSAPYDLEEMPGRRRGGLRAGISGTH